MIQSIKNITLFAVLLAIASAIGTAMATLPAHAQVAPPTSQPSSEPAQLTITANITIEQVQAKIQQITTAEELDDAMKATALDLCNAALVRLEAAKTNTDNAAAYRMSIDSLPTEIENTQQALKLANAQSNTTEQHTKIIDIPPDATAKSLEQLLIKEQADQANLKSQQAEIEQQIKEQLERPELARVQHANARQVITEIDKDLARPALKDEHPVIAESRRMLLAARKLARTTEANMIEQELLTLPPRQILLNAQHDLNARLLALSSARINKLQGLVSEARRAEAEKATAEAELARQQAAGKLPVIRAIAEQNTILAKEHAQLQSSIEEATNSRHITKQRYERLDKQFSSARDKLNIAGLSDALGPVLREQRKNLPDMRSYRKHTHTRSKHMAEYGLRYLKTEEQRRELSDIQSKLDQILANAADSSNTDYDPAQLEIQARQLLEDQRDSLVKLAESYANYLNELGSLNFEEKQLVELAEQYATFLDEKLLWIPSTQHLNFNTFHQLWQSILWATNTRHWADTARAFWGNTFIDKLYHALAVMIYIAMVATRKRLRIQLDVYNGRVGIPYADSFWITIATMGIVGLLSIPLPFITAYVAWRLMMSVDATDFAKAIGVGLATAATFGFLLQTMFLLCRDKGPAQTHFRWHDTLTKLIRSTLTWLIPIAIVTGLIVSATDAQPTDTYRKSLGRLAFIVGMIAFAVFIHKMFRAPQGITNEFILRKRKGWLSQLFWIWYPPIVGTPLVLACLAAVGYYYTAFELGQRLLASDALIVTITITYALVLRWLFVARQKLEITRAREKLLAKKIDSQTTTNEASHESTPEAIVFPEIAIEEINQHTRRLLRAMLVVTLLAGLWLIWAPILPALRIFDSIALWHQTITVEGQQVLQPITLTNLTTALFLATLTIVAARNLPSVLELAILQRLPLDSGTRYAIATTCRYIITALGVMVVFNIIGIGWTRIQWLVAALSVGLGFGLQEIVANFVSGLIILFERPIRVGDTVTVGNITGTVSQIKIRATTITNWDRKELVVPNKEFITGQLINWSLSDPILRLIISVGVAYGSDTELTRDTLLQIAKQNPLVLDEPPATVIFSKFGDSSLNFDLRVFVPNVTQFVSAQHELNMEVDKAFKKAGIVIAFPQRDLHMDTEKPLEIKIIKDQPTAE